jgi:hypothetical protein
MGVDPGSDNARRQVMIAGTGVWGGARRAGLALLLAAGLVGTLTGCASTARYPVAERDVKEPARIRNLSMRAVRVYLEEHGHAHLIGSVPPLSSARLEIPPELARHGTRLGLLVAPVLGRSRIGERILVGDVRVEDLTTNGWTVVDSSY